MSLRRDEIREPLSLLLVATKILAIHVMKTTVRGATATTDRALARSVAVLRDEMTTTRASSDEMKDKEERREIAAAETSATVETTAREIVVTSAIMAGATTAATTPWARATRCACRMNSPAT